MTATGGKNTTGNSGGSGAEANPTPSPSWRGFRRFVRGRFDLSEDKASESEVIENIRKGIEFKGTNLWVLVFATFIASLGLNVNSTAVIIGRDVDLAVDGTDYGDRALGRNQRFRTDEALAAQLRVHGAGQYRYIDFLFCDFTAE